MSAMADSSNEIAHRSRALKAPRIRACAAALADRARETSGSRQRVKNARLPAVKTLDDFDFGFARSVRKQVVLHLAQLAR